jgi:hypothetical protein
MPLCYHPSIEYQLDGLVRSASSHVDALFTGDASQGRRGAVVAALRAAGVSVQVTVTAAARGHHSHSRHS